MLTLEQCKKILAEEASGLTNEQIMEMRNWLSIFAEIIVSSIDFSLPNDEQDKNQTV